MATNITEIAAYLSDEGLRFRKVDEQRIITGFGGMDNYRDSDGDPALTIVVLLQENGEYISVFAPKAYMIPEDRATLFMQACSMIQWKTKLIQFEYDQTDGEVRPVIEFPLEDARLTQRQLMRCLSGLSQLIDKYHPVLQRVLDDGEIEFQEEGDEMIDMLGRMLSSVPPEVLTELLRRADERRGGD